MDSNFTVLFLRRIVMKEIKITSSKEYNVLITSGGSGFYSWLNNNRIKNLFIITDENVNNLHSNFIDSMKDRSLGTKILKPGESTKNINTLIEIYNDLVKLDINKKTVIVSVGGGVIGDLSGFIASTYMRGIGLIHVPTTLMAQCDSSIGGKTGFNFGDIKNIVGTFYQPNFVYTDVNFVKTLNEKEYKNGIAEILKYGYVCDENLFKYIEQNKKGIKEREVDKLLHIIYECVLIKGKIVEKDELDTEERHILNFGHTIGHGIESATNFNITHGEAVAIGMNLESNIGLKMGLTDYSSHNRLLNLLKYFELPYKFDDIDVDLDKVISFINKDKKKTSGLVKFVLPHNLGHAIITTDIKKGIISEIAREMVGY